LGACCPARSYAQHPLSARCDRVPEPSPQPTATRGCLRTSPPSSRWGPPPLPARACPRPPAPPRARSSSGLSHSRTAHSPARMRPGGARPGRAAPKRTAATPDPPQERIPEMDPAQMAWHFPPMTEIDTQNPAPAFAAVARR
jgi:hypothetical protein